MTRLNGKTALVTGSTDGVGRVVALAALANRIELWPTAGRPVNRWIAT